jgi:hypothetical protein
MQSGDMHLFWYIEKASTACASSQASRQHSLATCMYVSLLSLEEIISIIKVLLVKSSVQATHSILTKLLAVVVLAS